MKPVVVSFIAFVFACTIFGSTLNANGISDDVVPGRLKIRFRPELSIREQQLALQHASLQPMYCVLPYEQSVTRQHENNAALTFSNVSEILRIEEQLLRTYVVEFADHSITPQRKIAQLQIGCGDFEIAEPVYLGRIMGKPNDPMIDTVLLLQTIKAFEAWDVEDGDDSVVIGIIDTGVLQDHEDLRDALHVNSGEIPNNGIDDDANGYIDDYNGYNFCFKDDGSLPGNTFNAREGHGTGVAGIAGARVNNGVGIAGVANKCKIMAFKTMPDYISGIVYGYEALMYCATNGIAVANCSWGSGSKSCIDSTVVAYVISRGVLVVGAAGNHGTAAPFYPSSYPGVLSVGVTDPQDSIPKMSAFGVTVDVMAPGHESVTTSNDSTYFGFCCTSGSAPIVSGIAALVRSKYPLLSPIEAAALIRETVDESPWADVPPSIIRQMLPRGRVNALKAVTLSPDSIPSIEYDEPVVRTTANDGRSTVGDTIDIAIDAINILGPWTVTGIKDLTVVSPAQNPGITLTRGSGIGFNESLLKGDTLRIRGIQCIVDAATDTTAYILGTVIGITPSGDTVRRQLRIPVTPAPSFRDLSNDVLLLSVGDRVRIGNTDLAKGQGSGVRYKQWCGQLYEGGLMLTANGRVVDAIRSMKSINDHFHPIKRFISPDPLVAIASDGDAPDSLRIGVEIEQHVRIAEGDSGLFIDDITITNTTPDTLHDLSSAWFYDWDIGVQPARNTVRLELGGRQFAIEAIESVDDSEPHVLCAADSEFPDAVAIAGGIDNTSTYGGINQDRKLAFLYSGKTQQYNDTNDVAAISGMRFILPVPPGEKRSFRHVIAIDTDLDRARTLILGQITSIENDHSPNATPPPYHTNKLQVFPNPSRDEITVSGISTTTQTGLITLVDIHGRVVLTADVKSDQTTTVRMDVSSIPTGLYVLCYHDATQRLSVGVQVIH